MNMAELVILSHNVNGLGNRIKRNTIFNNIQKNKDSIHFLQETFSTQEIEQDWQDELKEGKLIFNHGSKRARGTLIYIPNNLKDNIVKTMDDNNGRIIIMDIKIQNEIYTMINVYMPTSSNKNEQIKQ